MRLTYLAILLAVNFNVMGHSGRTNADGCHTDRSTGEYHCHNDTTDDPVITYTWNYGVWSDCTGDCTTGKGTKSRLVYCKDSNGNSASDSQCTGSKPESVTSCSVELCIIEPVTYSWKYGAWSECTGDCKTGDGIKTRNVYCEDSNGHTVNDSQCTSSKPVSVESCSVELCIIEPDPTYETPQPQKTLYPNDFKFSRADSSFLNNTAFLDCLITENNEALNVELLFNGDSFHVAGLEPVTDCQSYSSLFTTYNSLATIYSVAVGNVSYRAQLYLNSDMSLSLVDLKQNGQDRVVADEYNRDDWGDWASAECGDTRRKVLSVFNQDTSQSNACMLVGIWLDPYTNDVITDSTNIDIDHIVPISWAHHHGGAAWPVTLKKQFYNDLDNLLPVSASANRSKGDKAPDEWMPENSDYHCVYVDAFLYIVDKYQLDASDTERAVIQSQCTSETD